MFQILPCAVIETELPGALIAALDPSNLKPLPPTELKFVVFAANVTAGPDAVGLAAAVITEAAPWPGATGFIAAVTDGTAAGPAGFIDAVPAAK